MNKKYWKHGQIKQLAELAGISQNQVSDITRRRRNVSYDRAKLLETCAASMGLTIPALAWLNKDIKHPAFKGG